MQMVGSGAANVTGMHVVCTVKVSCVVRMLSKVCDVGRV